MELRPDQMYKVFENLGFTDFALRDYSDELGKLLSSAAEDNAKTYVVDVVPGGLEAGLNDGIALMEKHYYQPARYERLREKWNEIIIQFLCYYPLKSILVAGMALPSDENFLDKTPNQNGYVLEFDLETITDLDDFIARVLEKTYGNMTFWFQFLQMAFHYFQDDVYLTVSLKEQTEESAAAIKLLEKLVEAQGLFLTRNLVEDGDKNGQRV